MRRDIGLLSGPALKVLRHFARHPGDKARFAGSVLGIDTREVNQLMHGPLKQLCQQDAGFGWTVLLGVDALLDQLFP